MTIVVVGVVVTRHSDSSPERIPTAALLRTVAASLHEFRSRSRPPGEQAKFDSIAYPLVSRITAFKETAVLIHPVTRMRSSFAPLCWEHMRVSYATPQKSNKSCMFRACVSHLLTDVDEIPRFPATSHTNAGVKGVDVMVEVTELEIDSDIVDVTVLIKL